MAMSEHNFGKAIPVRFLLNNKCRVKLTPESAKSAWVIRVKRLTSRKKLTTYLHTLFSKIIKKSLLKVDKDIIYRTINKED
jgi:hypothetical protein